MWFVPGYVTLLGWRDVTNLRTKHSLNCYNWFQEINCHCYLNRSLWRKIKKKVAETCTDKEMFPLAYCVYFQGGKQTFSTELIHVSPPVLSVNTSHRLEHAPRSWEMSALTRAHRYPDLLSGDVHNKLYTCDGIFRSFPERKYTKHGFAFSGFQDRNLLSLSAWNSSHFLRLIYGKRRNTEADANSHLNKLQIISWPKFPVNVLMRREKGPL